MAEREARHDIHLESIFDRPGFDKLVQAYALLSPDHACRTTALKTGEHDEVSGHLRLGIGRPGLSPAGCFGPTAVF